MILTVCMSPCIDVTVELGDFKIGKTNIVKRKRLRAGGKAFNVALDVAGLGEQAAVTGFMYTENGEMFESMLEKNGVESSFIYTPGRVRENYKFIDYRSMLTEVNDSGAPVTAQATDSLLAAVREYSGRSEATVISGGLPAGVPESYYGELFHAVSPQSLRIADATGHKLFAALDAGVDMIKPNLEELENCLGRELKSKEEILRACFELIDRGAKTVLLSLGKYGAIYTDGKESYYCRSTSVAVNSTVGAGDAMVAGATIKLKDGATMSEILRAGVAAGTAAVCTFEENNILYEKYLEIYKGLKVEKI